MRQINTPLGHHLAQITIAEFIGYIPADAENDDCGIEMSAFEQRG